MLVSHSSGDEHRGAFTSADTKACSESRPNSPRCARGGTSREPRCRGGSRRTGTAVRPRPRTLPSGNTPAGVVPSPDRRSASGREPLLPSRAATGLADIATDHRSTAPRSAASPWSTSHASAATITNCRVEGCVPTAAAPWPDRSTAPGVNATSRSCHTVAVAARRAPAGTDGIAIDPARRDRHRRSEHNGDPCRASLRGRRQRSVG